MHAEKKKYLKGGRGGYIPLGMLMEMIYDPSNDLQDNLHAYTLFARTEDRKNEWIQAGFRTLIRSFGKFGFGSDSFEILSWILVLLQKTM